MRDFIGRGGAALYMRDKEKYCVYVHTCPNGKRYIGITFNTPEKRWGHGTGYQRNKHFWNAIKKYGWENIKHEILYSGLDKEQACEKEKECISKYKTNCDEYGYNHTNGGEHYEFSEHTLEQLRKPKNLSEESRQKMRERGKVIYEKHLKGREITPEQIKKMAATKRGKKQPREVVEKRAVAIKERWKANGGFSEEHRAKLSKANKGKTHTTEAIEKMRAAKCPEKNPRSRPVIQKQGDSVIAKFCSAREAGRQTGIDYASIVRACVGKRLKHAGGYSWEYA